MRSRKERFEERVRGVEFWHEGEKKLEDVISDIYEKVREVREYLGVEEGLRPKAKKGGKGAR